MLAQSSWVSFLICKKFIFVSIGYLVCGMEFDGWRRVHFAVHFDDVFLSAFYSGVRVDRQKFH